MEQVYYAELMSLWHYHINSPLSYLRRDCREIQVGFIYTQCPTCFAAIRLSCR